jgi:flagellar protein FlgJ
LRPEEFVKELYPKARPICQKNTIPTVGCLAQAALETGWGESHPNHNWFGIKPWRKDQPISNQKTTEELDGKPGLEEVVGEFVQYQSFEDSVEGYCAFIRGNRRYKEALGYLNCWRSYVVEITKAKYATDPNYSAKVTWCGQQIERLIYQLGLEE